MSPITITLRQIEAHDPCETGWDLILAATHLHEGDHDKHFPLSEALDTNGFSDTVWAMCCLPEHDSLWRKYALWCARQAQHLMHDQRSIDALDVAWRYACGEATAEELEAARVEAWAAALAETTFMAEETAAWAVVWALVESTPRAALRVAAQTAVMTETQKAQSEKLHAILDAGVWL